MRWLWVVLVCLMITPVMAKDYQVKIYLDEIKTGAKVTYASTVTFRGADGKVQKTLKNTYLKPVLSIDDVVNSCRTVSVKEEDGLKFTGLVMICSGGAIVVTPELLKLLMEPK